MKSSSRCIVAFLFVLPNHDEGNVDGNVSSENRGMLGRMHAIYDLIGNYEILIAHRELYNKYIVSSQVEVNVDYTYQHMLLTTKAGIT